MKEKIGLLEESLGREKTELISKDEHVRVLSQQNQQMLELLESLNYISCEMVELELSEDLLVTWGHKLHTCTISTVGALSGCDHQNEGGQLLIVLPSARQPHLPSHQRSGAGSHNPDMERTDVGLLELRHLL